MEPNILIQIILITKKQVIQTQQMKAAGID